MSSEQPFEIPQPAPGNRVKTSIYAGYIQEAMRYNKLRSVEYSVVMTILRAISQGHTEEEWRQEQQKTLKTLIDRYPDHTTSAHSLRLVHLAQVAARQLQFSEANIYLIGLAALLHDIGKVNIPKSILEKPGRLTAEEWAVIHQHPTMGYDMLLQEGNIFARLAPIVLTHHERWDGRGYPLGLAGEAIPLEARILAVVDAY